MSKAIIQDKIACFAIKQMTVSALILQLNSPIDNRERRGLPLWHSGQQQREAISYQLSLYGLMGLLHQLTEGFKMSASRPETFDKLLMASARANFAL
ncbi:hypothetical protein [Winslowiella iniecta]|nr:hypothetical protein [Winslowiella iniecta]